MPAKGTSAWYAAHRQPAPLDLDAEMAKRRATARDHGMFDEQAERHAFEAFIRDSRSGKGATFLTIALRRRWVDQSYEQEATQRHWHTWQIAVGGGRLLPKFDAVKLAAERATQAARDRQFPEAD